MIAVYIVHREDIPDLDAVKDAVDRYCKRIIENDTTISFIAQDGFLATLGLFFTEKRISYHLEFAGHSE